MSARKAAKPFGVTCGSPPKFFPTKIPKNKMAAAAAI